MKSSKKIFVCIVLIIISIISFILINKKVNNKTFNYNGSTIALTIDGNSATSFPTSGKYSVSVDCKNASGKWNPKTWKLEITKITGTVTCDVSFNSSVNYLNTEVNNKATRDENGKRYEDKYPNNYIWFNDELWRIIGNIPVCLTSGCTSTEKRVKIIKNESIGAFTYDIGKSSTWIGSTIQNLLNTCYLGKASSCESYCYLSMNSIKGTCDYSTDGIDENDFYGLMIENVYYNIGAGDGTYKNAANYYIQETASHTTTALKIGLMYASDWGFAIADYNEVLGGDNTLRLSAKNWLFSQGFEWTMSEHSSSKLVLVHPLSYLDYGNVYGGNGVRPVLYLKSDVYVVSGTGTQVDPYRIGM